MSKRLAGRVDLDLAIATNRDLEAERCDVAECREGQGVDGYLKARQAP